MRVTTTKKTDTERLTQQKKYIFIHKQQANGSE